MSCDRYRYRLAGDRDLVWLRFAMASPFLLEQQVAIAAVRRACSLTTTVFNKLVVGETLVKGDKSPVTGAHGFTTV